MAEIAPLSNERCVHRGISVMRLALGYNAPLPQDWWFKPNGGRYSPHGLADEIRQIKQSFPQHNVVIFCNLNYKYLWEDWGLQRHEYMSLETLEIVYSLIDDDAIFAFSYLHNGNTRSHFVIGNPVDSVPTLYAVAIFW